MKVSGPRLLIGTAVIGVVLVGGLIAGAATGVIQIRVATAPPRYESIAGAARYAAFLQNLDLASDGSLKLNGRATTLATLEADLQRAFERAGAPAERSSQPVIIWATSETHRSHLDVVRAKLAESGWTDVELAMMAKLK